ncbi:L-rhamnose isomerase [Granulicatella sp. UMB5615A]|nr:L-rhamnose isomerase [Granulicatella sp. UMB5615A]
MSKGLKINDVPVGLAWYNEVKAYEEQVLSKRN